MPQGQASLINRKKLIGAPMALVVLALVIISVAAYFTSRHMLVNQMKQDGLNLANQVTHQIQGNEASIELAEDMVEEHIRSANRMVMDNIDLISDAYLTRMAQITLVDEITWYSPEGQVLFASQEASRRPVTAGDPLYAFLRGDERELMEPVRSSAITGKNFQYGAQKHESGYFIQSGILAENILTLTQRFSYQSLVTQLAQNPNVVDAYMVNRQHTTVASADLTQMGLRHLPEDNPDMEEAFGGHGVAMEHRPEHLGQPVIRISAPLMVEGDITHLLVMELSMAGLQRHLVQVTLIFTGAATLLLFLFYLLIKRNVVQPVRELDESIRDIDVKENMDYRLRLSPANPFYGLGLTVNKILDQTQAYFTSLQEKQSDLETSHQNIAQAYEKLRNSEEALSEQLEHIQQQQEWIQHQAYHDDLTQLPNRRHFMERLASCLQHEYPGAVILIDTDNFKGINDTKGHIFGDRVLKQITHELVKVLGDNVFLSRFGGDEFLILLDRESNREYIESVAQKIRTHFNRPIPVMDQQVNLTLSLGVACYPQDGTREEELIMKADMALHQVKQKGKNHYLFFDDTMTAALTEKARVERLLRLALEQDGLNVVYHPQVRVADGSLAGFEALVRMKDNSLSPAVFIPVAEEIGLIDEIGRFVTGEVIAQLGRWKRQQYPVKSVAINFSALQLNDVDYIDFLEAELDRHQVPADLLEIEITESIFLENQEQTLAFLRRLRRLGVSISIDDFGTGYSSLSYLSLLPVDMVKLDKSLIDRFLETDSRPVIKSLVSLVHSLQLEVVAEGVEAVSQYQLLADCGCDFVQGYLFSKPLPPQDAEAYFHANFHERLQTPPAL